ncbi:hypothetical protein HK101_008055 [Irineochytrium annulatum]|nr:hypothetical protein HK101_008055 [Irineochytrium annulatum]
MSAKQDCGACSKAVFSTEKVEGAGKWWHRGCFKCSETSCGITLNLKTFQAKEGKLYCGQHVPKHKATAIADSMSMVQALNAPKKGNEGLHKVQLGTGEAPTYGIETMSHQHALNAPRRSAENIGHVQKTPRGLGSDSDVSGRNSTGSRGSRGSLTEKKEVQRRGPGRTRVTGSTESCHASNEDAPKKGLLSKQPIPLPPRAPSFPREASTATLERAHTDLTIRNQHLTSLLMDAQRKALEQAREIGVLRHALTVQERQRQAMDTGIMGACARPRMRGGELSESNSYVDDLPVRDGENDASADTSFDALADHDESQQQSERDDSCSSIAEEAIDRDAKLLVLLSCRDQTIATLQHTVSTLRAEVASLRLGEKHHEEEMQALREELRRYEEGAWNGEHGEVRGRPRQRGSPKTAKATEQKEEPQHLRKPRMLHRRTYVDPSGKEFVVMESAREVAEAEGGDANEGPKWLDLERSPRLQMVPQSLERRNGTLGQPPAAARRATSMNSNLSSLAHLKPPRMEIPSIPTSSASPTRRGILNSHPRALDLSPTKSVSFHLTPHDADAGHTPQIVDPVQNRLTQLEMERDGLEEELLMRYTEIRKNGEWFVNELEKRDRELEQIRREALVLK